tara:strand:+ start:1826 stop:2530 length:705 start_codon:yes stop_codon:yes gene_type:complete
MNTIDRKTNRYIPPSSGGRVKKNSAISNKIDLTTEMFPELSSNSPTTCNVSINNVNPMSKSVWSPPEPENEVVNEDESNYIVITDIDVQNSKYWKGVNWVGPVIIRGNTKSSTESNDTNRSRIEYSRDNIHWRASLEETFTEEYLERKKIEHEQQEYEEKCEDVYRIMNEYSRNIEAESERYYYETGELDEYALAVFARKQYEDYAKQFDMTDEDVDSGGDIGYDEEEMYLEED